MYLLLRWDQDLLGEYLLCIGLQDDSPPLCDIINAQKPHITIKLALDFLQAQGCANSPRAYELASSLTNKRTKEFSPHDVRRLLDKDWHYSLLSSIAKGRSPNISMSVISSNLTKRNISLSKVYDAIEQVRATIPVEEALCLLSVSGRGNWNELEILLVRIIVDRATEFDMNAVVKSAASRSAFTRQRCVIKSEAKFISIDSSVERLKTDKIRLHVLHDIFEAREDLIYPKKLWGLFP